MSFGSTVFDLTSYVIFSFNSFITIYRVYIKRAAEKIGLRKRIGWHTFLHTFGTILNANGENPKVIQELLRHANLKVTMDTYVQAVTDEKGEAQNKVVKMILPGIRRAVI
ncbi:MAG TPA: hypothetical protein DCK93_14870 [Blastocatellia bacterium]|nr:hypothetical protein [Blastocatellia bacterium]